jgi:hypothetical protein
MKVEWFKIPHIVKVKDLCGKKKLYKVIGISIEEYDLTLWLEKDTPLEFGNTWNSFKILGELENY